MPVAVWSVGLRAVAARFLELRVRIPPLEWVFVYCECYAWRTL